MAVDIRQDMSPIFDLTSTDQLEFVVTCLQSSIMTEGKGALPKLTHHRLCTRSTSLQQSTAAVSWNHFDWLHCTLDPVDAHPTVDLTINSIPPRHAYHPDYDAKFLCFSPVLPNVYVDWDSFLPSLFTRPWDTKNQADFLKRIYVLPPRATRKRKPCSDTRVGIFFGETKALSQTLHSRHSCHATDHYDPPNSGRE